MKMPKVPAVVYAAIGIVALVWLYMWLDRRNDRELGVAKAEAAMLRAAVKAAQTQVAKVDTQYVADTAALRNAQRSYRSVADSARRLADLARRTRTDTITTTTTVTDSTALGAALVALALADTAIARGDSALRTSEMRVSARDTLIARMRERQAAESRLAAAKLRAAKPLLLPYVEAGKVLTDAQTYYARAGVELRLFGPIRLLGAVEGTRMPDHTTTGALVGLRVNFR